MKTDTAYTSSLTKRGGINKSSRRHRNLAKAFMRGIPYKVVELRTRADNVPCVYDVVLSAWRHPERISLAARHALTAAIQSWLDTPATPEQLAAYEAARAAYIAEKKARSEAVRYSRRVIDTGTAISSELSCDS